MLGEGVPESPIDQMYLNLSFAWSSSNVLQAKFLSGCAHTPVINRALQKANLI